MEAVGGDAPPTHAEATWLQTLVSLADDERDDGATIATVTERPTQTIQNIVLTSQDSGRRTVVGGVLLEMPASALQQLDLEFRSALAAALRSPH